MRWNWRESDVQGPSRIRYEAYDDSSSRSDDSRSYGWPPAPVIAWQLSVAHDPPWLSADK
jgi:hypothetical protein